jgi:hypothetical protein
VCFAVCYFCLVSSSLVIKAHVVNFDAVHIFQSVGEICLYLISFVTLCGGCNVVNVANILLRMFLGCYSSIKDCSI